MTSYLMETRHRVLEFLRSQQDGATQRQLQFLGMKTKQVRFDSLKLILEDLTKDGQAWHSEETKRYKAVVK